MTELKEKATDSTIDETNIFVSSLVTIVQPRTAATHVLTLTDEGFLSNTTKLSTAATSKTSPENSLEKLIDEPSANMPFPSVFASSIQRSIQIPNPFVELLSKHQATTQSASVSINTTSSLSGILGYCSSLQPSWVSSEPTHFSFLPLEASSNPLGMFVLLKLDFGLK